MDTLRVDSVPNGGELTSRGSFVGTMKEVPEEEEAGGEEVWSSLTTPPPKLPCALLVCGEEEYAVPEPPDGGWGWVIVAASFLCNMVVDGIAYSFGIFLSHFVQHYKSSSGKTAWVGSLLAGCYLLAGPAVSALTNKFGCRPVTIAGSLISCVAFFLSTLAPSVDVLMFTYGIMAGLGFGLIYLPAIVSVGYYFSTKRAFATGIAVCGSGMGAFVFAPLTQALLEAYHWKGALMILSGLSLNCCVFGALMRPLEATPTRRKGTLLSAEKGNNGHALLGEDGVRVPLVNTEPGVQSTLHLDQMAKVPLLPGEENLRQSMDVVPGLLVTPGTPTISTQQVDGSSLGALGEGRPLPKPNPIKVSLSHINVKELQRRFTMPAAMPLASTTLLLPTSNNNYAVDSNPRGDSVFGGARRQRRLSSKKDLARPLYRKDIFYSGSIVNLPEYRQSKHDIRCYISSVTTIPQVSDDEDDILPQKSKGRGLCPKLPKSMTDTLKEALDFSLLRDKAFLLACIANVFGMMGFYVPFVYITDSSRNKGVESDAAAFILSIIGIANLCGRLLFGWVVDRLQVKALDINNVTLFVSGIAVWAIPFCHTYATIVVACTVFGAFVSAYISLTSIILVDMVGLDRLTNSFGLLSLFRGAASIVGPPLAGTLKDFTGSYDIPFFLAGSLLFASGICCFFIPWVSQRPRIAKRLMDLVRCPNKNTPVVKITATVEDAQPENDPTTCL